MIKIYDQNKVLLGISNKYSDMCIESNLSDADKTLSFTYKDRNIRIRNEYYIETRKDIFVVKNVDESSGDYPQIDCRLDLEELEENIFGTFSAQNVEIEAAVSLALDGTGWTAEYSDIYVLADGADNYAIVDEDGYAIDLRIDKIRSVATRKANPLQVMKKIADAWMMELSFDTKNKVVHMEKEIGNDRGVYFISGLNLTKLSKTSDSYDYCTRLIPIGADDLGIEEENGGLAYVENHQYSNKIITTLWEDTSYEDALTLMMDAKDKLADLSKPKISYSADVIDLAKQSSQYSVLNYELGDEITIIDPYIKTREKQRIVKMTEYPQTPWKNSCELSNTVLTFEELQEKLARAADAVEDITNSDGSVKGVLVHYVDGVGIETVINKNSSVTGLQSDVQMIREYLGI